MQQEQPEPCKHPDSDFDYKLAFEASYRYGNLLMSVLEDRENSSARLWWLTWLVGVALGWAIRNSVEGRLDLQAYTLWTILSLLGLFILLDMWRSRKPLVLGKPPTPKE